MDCISLAFATTSPAARVIEADRHGVLTAPVAPRMPCAGLDELAAAAVSERGRAPGSVVVRPGRPLQLLAVVHDLDRDPAWSEDWIEQAWRGVFLEAGTRGLTTLAVPLLGTVHGRLPRERALQLLAAAAAGARPGLPAVLRVDDPHPTTAARLRAGVERAAKA
jgi:hypothetical protein